MCGIAGILSPGRSSGWLDASAARMQASLVHRGPDAHGLWSDAEIGIALAHRRLSVIDLSPQGAQPMHSASGRFIIVYNGEVYNFPELRRNLCEAGVEFRGSSDTEVILEAIEAWGLSRALDRFIGMFAFALWDCKSRELHLVRDRLGIKPLFWAQAGSLFLFGSELKALLACDSWSPEIDRNALSAYVRWNYVPSPHCIFQGAAKLAPGTRLVVRPGEAPRIIRYWELREFPSQLESLVSASEAEEALENLLLDAVGMRMVADVPLGAFLSGGVDSSLVAALMQAQSSGPVQTFSIGFNQRDYNEAEYAKAVAEHLGTDHTELYVGPEEAMAVIPELPTMYDEPFADSSQIPTHLVSRLARQQVTVALSGDGGDELFAGYTRYHWAEMVRRRLLWLPRSIRFGLATLIDAPPRVFWQSIVKLLPPNRRPIRVGERAKKLAGFLREPDADSIYRSQHSQWPDPEQLVPGAREPRGAPFDSALLLEIPNFIRRMQYLDTVTYLPDDILTKVDRASMAVSLEARVPLLDHRVVEMAWSLPQEMKVRRGTDKWLLRKILYRYVPRGIVDRPKKGFGLPYAPWLRGPLRDWAEPLLDHGRLENAGYLNADVVRRAWNRFQDGGNVDSEQIWGVLMFEAWRDSLSAARQAGAAGVGGAGEPILTANS